MAGDTLNQAMIITAKVMYKEGFITKEVYQYFVTHYMIVKIKKDWLTGLMCKFLKREESPDDRTYFDMVKLIHPDNNEDDFELAELNQAREATKKKPILKESIRTDRFSKITED